MSAPLPDGLYESVITPRLQQRLDATDGSRRIVDLDPTLAPEILGRHIGDAVRRHLESVDPARRLEVVERFVEVLESDADDLAGGSILHSIYPTGRTEPRRPSTPLSEGALLTNARDEPGLGNELALEMESADEVDLLCAFVKFTGVTVLAPQFELLAERGISPRVLTTTYMGATTGVPSTCWSGTTALRSKFDSRKHRLACTQRPGSSGAILDSIPLMSAVRTSPAPRSWMGSNGTFDCPQSLTRLR